MSLNLKCDLKYKPMSQDDLLLSLDRLTRFKNPEIKYRRVFYDIILRHLISPSLSKHKLDELLPSYISFYAEKIWNDSVSNLYVSCDEKFSLKDLDNIQYEINDDYTAELMNTKLTIAPVINNINLSDCPLNLKFLYLLYNNFNTKQDLIKTANIIRAEQFTLFPVQKLVLTEGITEEILLPKFADVLNYNFDKNGVFILATGGKSKVLSLYAELKYILKIPIFVLLDNDADAVYADIMSILRNNDKAYLIKSGEFEDILSKELIQKAFIEMNYDVKPAEIEELFSENGTCYALENLWKSRNLGEFRKAHLAKAVKNCLTNQKYLSPEIVDIITSISVLK